MRSCGIDVLLQTDKLYTLLCQTGNDGQQIPGISGNSGNALHNHCVTGTDESHHSFEIFTVHIFAAGLIDEDLLDFLFLHHFQLSCLILLGGGATYIAYSHGTTPLSQSAFIIPKNRFYFSKLSVNFEIFQNLRYNLYDTKNGAFPLCH